MRSPSFALCDVIMNEIVQQQATKSIKSHSSCLIKKKKAVLKYWKLKMGWQKSLCLKSDNVLQHTFKGIVLVIWNFVSWEGV